MKVQNIKGTMWHNFKREIMTNAPMRYKLPKCNKIKPRYGSRYMMVQKDKPWFKQVMDLRDSFTYTTTLYEDYLFLQEVFEESNQKDYDE